MLCCSWRPVNTTSGLLCGMTNSADLPEAFLLVSYRSMANHVSYHAAAFVYFCKLR